jgi:hypothetical protein
MVIYCFTIGGTLIYKQHLIGSALAVTNRLPSPGEACSRVLLGLVAGFTENDLLFPQLKDSICSLLLASTGAENYIIDEMSSGNEAQVTSSSKPKRKRLPQTL